MVNALPHTSLPRRPAGQTLDARFARPLTSGRLLLHTKPLHTKESAEYATTPTLLAFTSGMLSYNRPCGPPIPIRV